MTRLLQTFVDALSVGSLYALIALGYTMVYGILRFINFAHSDVFMLGAWFSWMLARAMGVALGWGDDAPAWGVAAVLVGSMVLAGGLGFVLERAAYRPLRSAPRINVLITAIGVSLLLENVGQLPLASWVTLADAPTLTGFPFGKSPQAMGHLLSTAPLVTVAGVDILVVDVLVVGLSLALMLGLQALVYRTRVGLAMRAVAHDTRTAALMGIPVDATISFTFVVGSMLAAAAGFLYGQKYPTLQQPAHATWVLLGLKAFVAAVVGGIGNLRGAMAGGLLIAFIELFGAAYVSTQLRDVYVFGLLILVLLLRPEGLLGKATVEKV